MTWTPWITIAPDDAPKPGDASSEAVRRLYDSTRERTTGRPPDTMRLTSLTPDVARLIYDLQHTIERAAVGLTPKEKEIAALVVAVLNGCVH